QPNKPAPQAAVISVQNQRGGQRIIGQQPQLPVSLGDTSPARRILFADPIGVASDQGLRVLRLKQQGLTALFCRIGSQDQIDRRPLLREGGGPAFHGGRLERRDAVRVGFHLRFG